MKSSEILNWYQNYIESYFSENAKEIYRAILNDIDETDDIEKAAWKMAISSAKYSCKLSGMTIICFLLDQGIIECDSLENFPPHLPPVDFS